MKKIDFKNRIQSNPRLLRLKNPITGQIIDYEIQDLQESEIVENGTEITDDVLNTMQSNIEESCVAVSPTQPETNEKVWLQKGKNLLKLEETSQTLNGVTMTINSDGSITLNGTATDNTQFYISKQKIKLIGDYTFGITTDFSAIGHSFEVGGYVYGADGQYKYNISTNQPTKTLSDGEYISNFNIYFSSGAVFNNFVIYPQLEQGSTATEYEEYIDRKIIVENNEFLNVETMGIETITNENGTAIKFPDGTLIQKGYVYCATNGAGVIKYPVAFIDANNSITANNRYIGSTELGIILTTQCDSTTSGAIYFRKYVNGALTLVSDTSICANWIAIGRWK